MLRKAMNGWAAVLVAAAAVGGLVPSSAGAAISFSQGPNTASTSRLEWNFGDGAGNVERVDEVQWRNSGGTLGPNLAYATGAPPACTSGEAQEAWGQSYGDSSVFPLVVAAGGTGTWVPRGSRTLELSSSVPTACYGDSVSTPVRTRYSFFDAGAAASKVRVERRFSFTPATPDYPSTQGLRAYVPRLLGGYTQVVHPNSAGSALVTDGTCGNYGCLTANWDGTWLAINNPTTNAGMVILRDPGNTSPAKLVLDDNNNPGSNNSSVTLTKPAGGWKATLTETEYLCFYDATSWPVASRSPSSLPPGCSAAAVPVNTTAPSFSGTPRAGVQLTANPGEWDLATGAFGYQWSRCEGSTCTPIAGATGQSYTPVAADVGKQLRVTVTATATGGETETASDLSAAVGEPAPGNTTPPSISGGAAPGQTLTAAPGAWTGSPTSFAYAWLRCDADGGACTAIAGATGSTYGVTGADLGGRLRVRVVATNGAGPSAPVDSAPTAVVAEGNVALTNTAPPSITGAGDTPRVGDLLRSGPGSWSGAPTAFAYQWRRCDGFGGNCADIAGATDGSYRLTAADLQRTIRVRVVATNGGGSSAPIDSEATNFVREALPGPRPVARLRVAPNPTCTGVETRLDASRSTGSSPIAKYRFEYSEIRDGQSITSENPTVNVVVAEGASPTTTTVFTWNRSELTRLFDPSAFGFYLGFAGVRSVVLMRLTVTDARGQTGQAMILISFGQRSSADSRKSCPGSAISFNKNFLRPSSVVFTGLKTTTSKWSTKVPCKTAVTCVGAITGEFKLFGKSASAAARRKPKPIILFQSPLVIQAGRTQQVGGKLTSAGRRLLKKRKSLKATVTVVLLTPTGKRVITSKPVTLKAKGR